MDCSLMLDYRMPRRSRVAATTCQGDRYTLENDWKGRRCLNTAKSTTTPRRGTPYDGGGSQTKPGEPKNRYTHGFYNRQAGGTPTGFNNRQAGGGEAHGITQCLMARYPVTMG